MYLRRTSKNSRENRKVSRSKSVHCLFFDGTKISMPARFFPSTSYIMRYSSATSSLHSRLTCYPPSRGAVPTMKTRHVSQSNPLHLLPSSIPKLYPKLPAFLPNFHLVPQTFISTHIQSAHLLPKSTWRSHPKQN